MLQVSKSPRIVKSKIKLLRSLLINWNWRLLYQKC